MTWASCWIRSPRHWVRHPKLQAISDRIDADQIGLLGMSFGGGAITELCKSDARCRAGLNMDGGTFGQRQRQPLQVPYLGMTRENQDFLDYLKSASRSDYYAVEVKGTTHLDFTDDTVVLPILKWLNITGDIAGGRAIEITNAVSLRFFDAYLRGGPKPRFDDEFPELTVEMNNVRQRVTIVPGADAPAGPERAQVWSSAGPRRRAACYARATMQQRQARPIARSRSRRSPWAATCSAGRPTSRPRSRSSMRSSRTAATRSTPPTAIRIGCRGTHGGESETVIGRWLKKRGRHDDVVIGTKVGWWEKRKGHRARQHHRGLRGLAATARRRRDRSLLAAPRRRADAPDEYLGALDTLVKAGKVRAVGASNFGVERFKAALQESKRRRRSRSRSSRSSPSTAC